MIEPVLRPAEKPKKMSDKEWELSACAKSPTGAHWFKLSPSLGILVCIYCQGEHDKIHKEVDSQKRQK